MEWQTAPVASYAIRCYLVRAERMRKQQQFDSTNMIFNARTRTPSTHARVAHTYRRQLYLLSARACTLARSRADKFDCLPDAHTRTRECHGCYGSLWMDGSDSRVDARTHAHARLHPSRVRALVRLNIIVSRVRECMRVRVHQSVALPAFSTTMQ